MKALLKYLGKGFWIPTESTGVSPDDKVIRIKPMVKRVSKARSQTNDPFQDIDTAIEKNGYRSIK